MYLHPIHSFILDLGDATLEKIFSKAELLEIQAAGKTVLIHPMEPTLKTHLDEMGKKDTIADVYNYYRKLDFDPVSDPLTAWLSMAVTNTSFNFMQSNHRPTQLESDNMYIYWSFLNTVFFYSDIQALSKEKSSRANSNAQNNKRKLSSIEEIQRKAAGRRMDTVYVGAGVELGALEIRSKNDDTKDLSDGYIKLPIVMKDMLKHIVDKHSNLRNDVNIFGYNIQDNNLSFMNMDIPAGYITRIRRLEKLSYPTSDADYNARMPALLEIAYSGYKSMNDTLSKVQSCPSQIKLIINADANVLLPPTITPASVTSSKASTTSKASKASSSRKSSSPTSSSREN